MPNTRKLFENVKRAEDERREFEQQYVRFIQFVNDWCVEKYEHFPSRRPAVKVDERKRRRAQDALARDVKKT